ncbi:MAG: M1 family metallopeptidase, partial [Flavobacteriales bacterium]|nr:M1 family metallopeptidase [Flavobacteriales bacterium]
MKKTIFLILTLLSVQLFAQDYFQQETRYIINVELNDKNHSLIAEETIEYTNNSPDDLDVLWFHLWPNAYKNNSSALAKHELEGGSTELWNSYEEDRGLISDLNFSVNGKKVSWQYHPEHIDICKLILNKPIRAGESVTIKTPFKVKIPDAKFSRLGHVNQSYMITQWYPKPAVYDKNGWHIMPYLSQGEFYSEFGSFDVSITLPLNYTIGATGDLQNKGEHYRLDELAEIADTITNFGTSLSFPESDKRTKTVRYTQEKVHDFGWFADKRFNVLKGEVKLPHSGRTVTLYTMFTNNEAHLWKNSIEYMHDAVYYYSLWNGDYPYNYCTAVDGTIAAGGGMEYPNVTVIGASGTAKGLETVIMHEVGHNWFYGILGSNERDHAWMDEGINSYNEHRYMRTKYPGYSMLESFPNKYKKLLDIEDATNKNIMGELMYFMGAWTAKDQPIDFPSADYTGMNYGGIVYMKSAICFDYLAAYLGQELFDECMKDYFETWKFKHPHPKDLKAIFENNTGKDLSWFFDNMIPTTNQLDYSISYIQKGPKELLITLKNNGKIPGPVVICGVTDGIISEQMWIEGFEGTKTVSYKPGGYDHIRIDYNGDMPETNRNNNIYKLNGIFKKCEPIKLQLIGSLYHPEKTQIFFHPTLSWNKYNQFATGLSIYNRFIPKGGFSYKVSPMYSFSTKDLVGKGKLSFKKYSHSFIFSEIKLNLDAEQFNYTSDSSYRRLSPSIELILNEHNLRSKKESKISASYIHLKKDAEKGELEFIKGNYTFSNARTLNPYSLNLQLEKGGEFTKANLIMNYNYHLNEKNRLNIRGYFGYVKSQNTIYDLQMSSWNGSMDYSFSEKSFARSEIDGTLSNQVFIREGGLKHITNNMTSDNLLTSLSLDY